MTLLRSPIRLPIRVPVFAPHVGRLGIGVTPPSVTYLGRVTASGGSLDIGTADENCLVVGAFEFKREGAARTLTSLSIGGTNGTIHGQVGDATNGQAIAIVSRVVAGGGSTAFSWVLSGVAADSGLDVFRVDNLLSTTASDTMFPAAGNDPSSTIDFPANGIVIGAAAGNGQNAITWIGLTEETDANFGGTAIGRYSAASAGPTSVGAGTTVGITSASAAEVVGAVAWA